MQHVLDPLLGYLLALEYSLSFKVQTEFNFATSDNGLSTRDVLKIATEHWPEIVQETQISEASSVNTMLESELLHLNAQKAENQLGWKPNWSQNAAIKSTLLWWDKYFENSSNLKLAIENDIRNLLDAHNE